MGPTHWPPGHPPVPPIHTTLCPASPSQTDLPSSLTKRPLRGQSAASIGAGLAKASIGARVDDVLVDLDHTIDHDATISIITAPRKGQTPGSDALELIRHSCAHVMAEAIERVIPGVQLVYGPALEHGFYYDIAVPEDRPIREDDFKTIEEEMRNDHQRGSLLHQI